MPPLCWPRGNRLARHGAGTWPWAVISLSASLSRSCRDRIVEGTSCTNLPGDSRKKRLHGVWAFTRPRTEYRRLAGPCRPPPAGAVTRPPYRSSSRARPRGGHRLAPPGVRQPPPRRHRHGRRAFASARPPRGAWSSSCRLVSQVSSFSRPSISTVRALGQVFAGDFRRAAPERHVDERGLFDPFAAGALAAIVHGQADFGDGRAAGVYRSSGSRVRLPTRITRLNWLAIGSILLIPLAAIAQAC